jgi:hypothetical protein
VLGGKRQADEDVAIEQLRIVKPRVRESMVFGDREILPRVGTGWVCDCEFHHVS